MTFFSKLKPSPPTMIRQALAVISVPLLLCGWLGAQETIAVRTLALGTGEMPEVYMRGVKEHVALEFSTVQPGEMLRAMAASPLPLFLKETDARGNEAWIVAQNVNVPAGAKGILLLALPDGDQTRFLAIKDDFAGARYNDWLLINASSKPISFAVGEGAKPVLIASGSSTTHRVSAPAGQGTVVLAQAPIDDKPTVFYSTYWPVYDDRRTVVLFADSGPKILVKRISDILTR